MPGSVQSVERAAAILRLLASETEPLALAEVSAALALAKPTAHGLLRTLREVGFVEQDDGSGLYRLAPDLLHLGTTLIDLNELRSYALNWTDALAARTTESARVAVFRTGEVVIAHHVFGIRAPGRRMETGQRLPLHATALGKVLLAFDPGAARSIVGRSLVSYTYRTVTDRPTLLRQLADVRDKGWAAAVEEVEPQVAGIAAPVRDRVGHVVAAVGIVGSVDDLCDSRSRPRPALAGEVVRAARSISRELGHGRA